MWISLFILLKTKTVRLPKIKHPFYYKWLQKIHASVTRKNEPATDMDG